MSRQFFASYQMSKDCLSGARLRCVSWRTLAVLGSLVFTNIVLASQSPVQARSVYSIAALSVAERSWSERPAIAVIVRKPSVSEGQTSRDFVQARSRILTIAHLFGALIVLGFLLHTHVRFQRHVQVMSKRLD